MNSQIANGNTRARCVLAMLLLATGMLLPILANAGCGPVPGGPPNSCAGVASVGTTGGPDAGAGNPINVMTGNKYERETDMPALPGVLGLEIIRHYNSANSDLAHQNGVMGRGWRLSYETELFDMYGKIQIMQADGGRVIFDRDPKNRNLCSTHNPANGTMAHLILKSGMKEYVWTWTNGRALHFDNTGKLYKIKAPTGEVVVLDYDQRNVLRRVTDPQGRSLDLAYFDPKIANHFRGVQFIDSPVGRFEYQYGSTLPKGAAAGFDARQLLALMVRVKLPTSFDPVKPAHPLTSRGTTISQVSRLYHHEDPKSPWLLTGVSVETTGADRKPVATRFSTFGYDDDGRAILSTHVNSVNKVTLDLQESGKTVLTNSLGQKTTYLHGIVAGEHRLLEVRGAGCALCGEPNVRYRYNAVGQLTETIKLAPSGEPLTAFRTEFDKLGRVARIGKLAYVHGKAQPVQWMSQFKYQGGTFAPTVIARPSVVPGREVVTQIVYNAAGQPLSVTESGWVPTFDGLQMAGRIERITRYRYASINDWSLLIEIDGPLPNGKTNSPIDSDITVFEYDHRSNAWVPPKLLKNASGVAAYDPALQRAGVVSAIVLPGNRRSTVDVDRIGRIAKVKDTDGHETSLQFSPRGQLLTFTRDGLARQILYDSLDNPIETGQREGEQYQALQRLGYDAAGRNTWTASRLGIASTKLFDTEGQLLEQSNFSNTIKQTKRFEYDALGRLQSFSNAQGGTQRIGWNARGSPSEFTDALGRITRFGFDSLNNVTAVSEAINLSRSTLANSETRFELDVYGRATAVLAPQGVNTRYVRDDFSRTIATINADSGMLTRTYDSGDRLVLSADANGNRASYEYDVMDRIVCQRVIDAGNGGETIMTKWRYVGMQLVSVDHPVQSERYAYDAKGQVSAKTVILSKGGDGHISNTTRYAYDRSGRLSSTTLPDGSILSNQRNGQHRITALTRDRAGIPWLRWLFPSQIIVHNMERDVVGLRHLTYGNGIEAYYQRSREGKLARIVYRDSRDSTGGTRVTWLDTLLGITPALATPVSSLPPEKIGIRGALGLPNDPNALLDHRYLWDVQGNLLHTHDKTSSSSYAFDARDRLIATATLPTGVFSRYHYDDNGNRLLTQEGMADQTDMHSNVVMTNYASTGNRLLGDTGSSAAASVSYDTAGQPEQIGNRSFRWDALGKLLEVREGQRLLARYRYNHRGERIEKIVDGKHTYFLYENRSLVAELDGQGEILRQYVYLDRQPVAIIDTRKRREASATGDTLFGWLTRNLRGMSDARFDTGETMNYLHSNHLGATEMATDARGKAVWSRKYSPFGETVLNTHAKTSLEVNLRLPGQYADSETGFHYNDNRYYDPLRGRYLTPDPLGLRGGLNGYTYANANPLRYVDPQGLVLFAFDGTGNTDDTAWLTANGSSLSNVSQFSNLYDDGNSRYVTGVGTIHHDEKYGDIIPKTYTPGYVPLNSESFDMGGNYSGPARIARMVQYFNDEADLAMDEGAMVVDITGFSRGASEARDFANRIIANTKNGIYSYRNSTGHQVCQSVNFRFMGLFDTVLSTNYSGTPYNLVISSEFAYVAQALALNEHRGNTGRQLPGSTGAFPLESIMSGTVPQEKTRIERGFIGAHADIGGGFSADQNQLAAVALVWMADQAKLAGVKMFNTPTTIISNPVVHDKSDNQYSKKGAPIAPGIEDRTVRYQDGKNSTQMAMQNTGMTWENTQKLISYLPPDGLFIEGNITRTPRTDYVTGSVDMRSYLGWLNKNGYHIDLEVK